MKRFPSLPIRLVMKKLFAKTAKGVDRQGMEPAIPQKFQVPAFHREITLKPGETSGNKNAVPS